jgi:DNA modification methylase
VSDFRFIQGHALDVLRGEPDDFYDAVVTSPPYWRQRVYPGAPVAWPDGQVVELGQEPRVEDYIAHLLAVFDEVHRCVKPTASVYVNVGESFCGKPGNGRGGETGLGGGLPHRSAGVKEGIGLKKKDMVGVPWMFALAMRGALDAGRIAAWQAAVDALVAEYRADVPAPVWAVMNALAADAQARMSISWHLQAAVCWHKVNNVPGGGAARGRPDLDYEMVFRFSKGSLPAYDSDAIVLGPVASMFSGANFPVNRLRSVWAIPTDSTRGHHASMPLALATRCLRVSCVGPGSRVLDPFCGKGTTLLAARSLGAAGGLGIDMCGEYVAMAERSVNGGC